MSKRLPKHASYNVRTVHTHNSLSQGAYAALLASSMLCGGGLLASQAFADGYVSNDGHAVYYGFKTNADYSKDNFHVYVKYYKTADDAIKQQNEDPLGRYVRIEFVSNNPFVQKDPADWSGRPQWWYGVPHGIDPTTITGITLQRNEEGTCDAAPATVDAPAPSGTTHTLAGTTTTLSSSSTTTPSGTVPTPRQSSVVSAPSTTSSGASAPSGTTGSPSGTTPSKAGAVTPTSAATPSGTITSLSGMQTTNASSRTSTVQGSAPASSSAAPKKCADRPHYVVASEHVYDNPQQWNGISTRYVSNNDSKLQQKLWNDFIGEGDNYDNKGDTAQQWDAYKPQAASAGTASRGLQGMFIDQETAGKRYYRFSYVAQLTEEAWKKRDKHPLLLASGMYRSTGAIRYATAQTVYASRITDHISVQCPQAIEVADITHVSTTEKQHIIAAIKKANSTQSPDAPTAFETFIKPGDAGIQIADDGSATITYQDNSIDTIIAARLVTQKQTMNKRFTPLIPARQIVKSVQWLTDTEKTQLVQAIIAANTPGGKENDVLQHLKKSDGTHYDIAVSNTGDVTFTFLDNTSSTTPAERLIQLDSNLAIAGWAPYTAPSVYVDQPDHLTPADVVAIQREFDKANASLGIYQEARAHAGNKSPVSVTRNGNVKIQWSDGSVSFIWSSEFLHPKKTFDVALPETLPEVDFDPTNASSEDFARNKQQLDAIKQQFKLLKARDTKDPSVSLSLGSVDFQLYQDRIEFTIDGYQKRLYPMAAFLKPKHSATARASLQKLVRDLLTLQRAKGITLNEYKAHGIQDVSEAAVNAMDEAQLQQMIYKLSNMRHKVKWNSKPLNLPSVWPSHDEAIQYEHKYDKLVDIQTKKSKLNYTQALVNFILQNYDGVTKEQLEPHFDAHNNLVLVKKEGNTYTHAIPTLKPKAGTVGLDLADQDNPAGIMKFACNANGLDIDVYGESMPHDYKPLFTIPQEDLWTQAPSTDPYDIAKQKSDTAFLEEKARIVTAINAMAHLSESDRTQLFQRLDGNEFANIETPHSCADLAAILADAQALEQAKQLSSEPFSFSFVDHGMGAANHAQNKHHTNDAALNTLLHSQPNASERLSAFNDALNASSYDYAALTLALRALQDENTANMHTAQQHALDALSHLHYLSVEKRETAQKAIMNAATPVEILTALQSAQHDNVAPSIPPAPRDTASNTHDDPAVLAREKQAAIERIKKLTLPDAEKEKLEQAINATHQVGDPTAIANRAEKAQKLTDAYAELNQLSYLNNAQRSAYKRILDSTQVDLVADKQSGNPETDEIDVTLLDARVTNQAMRSLLSLDAKAQQLLTQPAYTTALADKKATFDTCKAQADALLNKETGADKSFEQVNDVYTSLLKSMQALDATISGASVDTQQLSEEIQRDVLLVPSETDPVRAGDVVYRNATPQKKKAFDRALAQAQQSLQAALAAHPQTMEDVEKEQIKVDSMLEVLKHARGALDGVAHKTPPSHTTITPSVQHNVTPITPHQHTVHPQHVVPEYNAQSSADQSVVQHSDEASYISTHEPRITTPSVYAHARHASLPSTADTSLWVVFFSQIELLAGLLLCRSVKHRRASLPRHRK